MRGGRTARVRIAAALMLAATALLAAVTTRGRGLSIARDVVTGKSGGTLTCTGSGPEGTTFTVRLPPTMDRLTGQTPDDETPAAA